jgi:hypothetical protein
MVHFFFLFPRRLLKYSFVSFEQSFEPRICSAPDRIGDLSVKQNFHYLLVSRMFSFFLLSVEHSPRFRFQRWHQVSKRKISDLFFFFSFLFQHGLWLVEGGERRFTPYRRLIYRERAFLPCADYYFSSINTASHSATFFFSHGFAPCLCSLSWQ